MLVYSYLVGIWILRKFSMLCTILIVPSWISKRSNPSMISGLLPTNCNLSQTTEPPRPMCLSTNQNSFYGNFLEFPITPSV
ncbi:hypothetical protein X975_24678, partial [Stegodyphus mimosarum]